jgi:hypothetical protein
VVVLPTGAGKTVVAFLGEMMEEKLLLPEPSGSTGGARI